MKLQLDIKEYKDRAGKIAKFLSTEQQRTICEHLEDIDLGTSIPENAIAFYLAQSDISISQGIRPNWLKNPTTGRNLEIDIHIESLGIGIEYDGHYYHQDVERDIRKDNIAQKSNYRIIHIRENGCPEMPESSICIKRKNNNDDVDLGECIKKCFEALDIPTPDINIARDKKSIIAFMRQRILNKINLTKKYEELSIAP